MLVEVAHAVLIPKAKARKDFIAGSGTISTASRTNKKLRTLDVTEGNSVRIYTGGSLDLCVALLVVR